MKTAWIVGGTLAALLLGVAAYGAKAADLNGGSYADLEERVAELEATAARKGNRKMSLTVSGQISRSILWIKEGDTSDHVMIDNFNSPSRLAFSGDGKINKDWSAGFLIEFGIGSPDDQAYSGDDEIVVRHSAAWLGTPVGKVWLGHTSTATDGIVEINLAQGVNVGALPAATWLGFDGGRQQVIKYESSALAGFTVAASFTGDNNITPFGQDTFDVALRYAGEFSGIRVAAGVGYADLHDEVSRISGSASVMHLMTGLFLAVNAGKMDVPAGDPKVYGASAGIEKNFFAIGATTVFVEYSKGQDVFATIAPIGLLGAGPIDEVELYGLGFNQAIDAVAADLFLNVRRITVEDDEATTALGGMRVRF